MNSRISGAMLGAVAALVPLAGWPRAVRGATLIDNPFVNSYSGWTDAFPTRAGNWRLSLHHPTLMDTNNANPPTTGGGTNTGRYEPDVLVQNNFLAPANYELAARMRTNDDDLLGLVWNYQDPDNYFRVGIRQQPSSGTFGGTEGLSVQKIVGGVVTQLVGPGVASPITQAMIDKRAPFDVNVSVNGANYEIFFNGASVARGSDAALAAGRKVGIQSWAQQFDVATVTPLWGTEIDTFTVTQGAATLFNESFERRPVPWRQVVMTNANGVSGHTVGVTKEVLGNFGMGIGNAWVHQDSNGNLTATFGNVDFIGPAVAVNESGSANFSNYQMQVRMGAADNDGMGVLVRVQDDNNFYRITFTNDATGPGSTRAPRGMSVHKVRNGVWSELYRDDSNPLFVPAVATAGTTPASPGFPMFDLSVGVVGNQLKVQVRKQAGDTIVYPLITDGSDPILTGTVGFHTWGNEDVYYMSKDGLDRPLVTSMSAFTDFDAAINRATGNITLTNNGAAPVGIRGVSILSSTGGLDPANWSSIAQNYDEPPGNGSVDPDDPWTITSSTAFSLSEREQSVGGNGSTLSVGQSVNFGNAWNRLIEDVFLEIELTDGAFIDAAVAYAGGTPGDVWDNSSGSGLWSDAVNWADDTEPGASQEVIFPAGFPNGDTTITLTAGEVARRLTFHDSYTLAGGALTLSGPDSVLHVDAAKTATISSALTVNGNLLLFGGGSAVVSHVRAAGGLHLLSGSLKVAPSGTDAGTSRVASIQINAGNQLDLSDNDLIIDGGNLAQITAYLSSGKLVSSSATAITTLGVILNGARFTTFSGQSVSPDDVLVKFTFFGDANFDGRVSIADFLAADRGFARNLTGWANGDFNLSGAIDGTDFFLIDNAFLNQGGALVAAEVTAAAAVPEPSAGVGLVVVAGLLGWRRVRLGL